MILLRKEKTANWFLFHCCFSSFISFSSLFESGATATTSEKTTSTDITHAMIPLWIEWQTIKAKHIDATKHKQGQKQKRKKIAFFIRRFYVSLLSRRRRVCQRHYGVCEKLNNGRLFYIFFIFRSNWKKNTIRWDIIMSMLLIVHQRIFHCLIASIFFF